MPPAFDHRHELAGFLRRRRRRIKPEQVGFPASDRRRQAGLRREEVAVLAGISPTWYTYLEQARGVKPSPQVIDNLADVLDLNADERRYLLKLIHGDATEAVPADSGPGADRLLEEIVSSSENVPLPVYAVDEYDDLLAWNHAATEYYCDWSRLPGRQRNVLRWILTAPEAKVRLADWPDEARDSVARLRARVPALSASPRFNRHVDDLTAISAEFADWWTSHEVSDQSSRLRRFLHPEKGLHTLRLSWMYTTSSYPACIVMHTAADVT